MKLFLLFLIIGVSPPESRVDRFPQSNSAYSGCDPREAAAGILVSSKIPRSFIFHYGKRELLMKDVAEGNIPEADWNDYIMGEKTRFKLKRYRRGFYGTEYAEDADKFGDATYNWLVEISLSPECLKSSRVTSLVYLSKNSAFQKWYESKSFSTSFQQWASICFDTAAYPRSKYFIDYKNTGESADFKESDCEKVVADYDEEQKFAFVHDYAGDLVRSWAIRDRGCISTINGSDAYWSREFAAREEFWVNTCNRERNHRNNIRVWFMAMENSGFDAHQLESFSKMIKELRSPEDRIDWASQESDRFAAQDFADSLAAVARRCGTSRQTVLRATLGEISKTVDQLQSSEVKTKLESLCR